MAVTVRELVARLGFRTDTRKVDQFNQRVDAASVKMGQARDRTLQWGTALKAGLAVVVSGALFERFFGNFADVADEAAKQATALGITAEAYQELGVAAEFSGTSIDGLSKGMRTLTKQAGAAARGGKGAQETFDALGISVQDANGELKSQEALLLEVADSFQTMENGTRKTELALKLFGGQGANLIPLLNAGAEGIEGMRQEARDLGVVISDETAAGAEQFNDSMFRAQLAVRGIRNQLAAKLLPAMTRAANSFARWSIEVRLAERITGFFEQNGRKLLIVLGAIATLKTAATVQQIAATALAGAKAFAVLGRAATLAQAKLLLIPAVIILIILLVEDFVTFMQGGESAIGKLLGTAEGAGGTIAKVAAFVRQGLMRVGEFLQRLGEAIVQLLGPIVPAIMEVAEQWFEVWSTMVEELLLTVEALLPELELLFKDIVNIALELFPVFVEIWKTVIGLVIEITASFLPIMLELWGTIFKLTFEIVRSLIPVVLRVVAVIARIIQRVLPALARVARAVIPIVLRVIRFVVRVVTGLIEVLIPIIEGIVDFIGLVIPPIVDFIASVMEGIVSVVSGAIDILVSVWEGFSDFMIFLWDGITSTISDAVDAILGIVSPVIDAVEGAVGAASDLLGLSDEPSTVDPQQLAEASQQLADVLGVGGALDVRAFGQRFAAQAGGGGSSTSTVTTGDISVNVEGTTNMGPSELSGATEKGINRALGRELRQTSRAFTRPGEAGGAG